MNELDQILSGYNPETVDVGQSTSSSFTASKAEGLQSARDKKLNRFTKDSAWGSAGIGEQDMNRDLYAEVGGFVEHAGNKIFNDYSPEELEYLGERLNREYGIVPTENGFQKYGDDGGLVPFEGDVSDYGSVYGFRTNDGNVKIGRWGGTDAKDRYSEEYAASLAERYPNSKKNAIGVNGVNTDEVERHWVLPREIANRYEALYHGSSAMMDRRVVRQPANGDLGEYQALRDQYGTGATEVYRPYAEGELTDLEEQQKEAVWQEFNDRFRLGDRGRVPKEDLTRMLRDRYRNRETGVMAMVGRVANLHSAVASTLASDLVVKPVDALSELLLGVDLGTAEELTSTVDDFFGYENRHRSTEAMADVTNSVTKIYDAIQDDNKKVDLGDFLDIMTTVGSTPELTAEIAAGTVAILFGFGKFTKFGGAVNSVNKAYRTGAITKEVAKAQVANIKRTATFMDRVKHLGASNAGYGLVTAGMVNTNVDKFKENNNGEAEATDVLRIAGITAAANMLDKVSGAIVMRSSSAMDAFRLGDTARHLKAVASSLTPAEMAVLLPTLKRSAAVIGGVSGSATLEGATEYAQTLAELTSAKWLTDKYGDDLGTILGSDESQIEAWSGAAIGFTSGGIMDGTIRAVPAAIRGGTKLVQSRLGNTEGTSTATPSGVTQPTVEEIENITREYGTHSEYLNSTTVTAENMGEVMRSAAMLDQIAPVVAALDPTKEQESTALTDKVTAGVVALLESGEGDVKLARRHEDGTSTPLKLATTQILASRAIQSVVDKHKDGTMDSDLEDRLYSFARKNGVTKEDAKRIIKSYETVELEATIEDRGVKARMDQLTLALDSGSPDPLAIRKGYAETANWFRKTQESIGQLNDGIALAKQEAQQLQAQYPSGGKARQVATEYITDAQSSSKGAPLTISVTYKDGKWNPEPASITEVRKRIAAKERTTKGLSRLLSKYHQDAAGHLDPGTMFSVDEYKVTSMQAKPSAGVTREENYVKEVNKAVQEVSGSATAKINRIVLGKAHADYWGTTGRRGQENALITNVVTGNKASGAYDASDVVYLHANDSSKTRGKETIEFNTSTEPLAQEMDAAIRAGATIVLASNHRNRAKDVGTGSKGAKSTSRGSQIAKWLRGKGYMSVGPSGVEKDIFVPATDDVKTRYEEIRKKNKFKSALKAKEKRVKDKAASLAVERAAKLDTGNGRDITEIDKELTDISKSMRSFFEGTAKRQVDKAVREEGVTLTDEELKTRVEEQITKNTKTFLDATPDRVVAETRKIIDEHDSEFSVEDIEDPSLRALVEKAIETESKRSGQVQELLKAWSAATLNRLTGKELTEALKEAASDEGVTIVVRRTENTPRDAIVLSELGKELLANAVSAGTDVKVYFVTVQLYDGKGKPNGTRVSTRYSLDTTRTVDGEKVTTRAEVGKPLPGLPKGNSVLRISEAPIDVTSYVKVSKATPLNTFSVAAMPAVLRDVMESTAKAFKEAIPALASTEKNFKPLTNDDKTHRMAFVDSPARGLVFGKDGEPNENMLASMGTAVRSYMDRNTRNLLPGFKEDAVIAAMFGIQEYAVTSEQREFAYKNGILAKTATAAIGKAIMQSQGMSRSVHDQVSRDTYDRLVTDLGSMAILTAEKEGILSLDEVKSNDFAKLTKKGDIREGDKAEAITYFLSMTNKNDDTGGKYPRKVPSTKAADALEQHKQVEDLVTDIGGTKKEPYFGKPIPAEVQDGIVRTVRNDMANAGVPAESAKAMKAVMGTEYELLSKELEGLAKYTDNPKMVGKVLERLGFITISESNPQYTKLTYEEKMVQEDINNDILKSVNNLGLLRKNIEEKTVPNSIYFPVTFLKVQRYNLDVNTVNGQTDKFHRYFVVPKSFRTTYRVDRSNNTLYYKDEATGQEEKNMSLHVRAALAQSFGVGIDKERTREIISLGNSLLSMSYKEVEAAEESYISTGEFTVQVGDQSVTLEPEELSHAMVAFDMLRSFSMDPTATSVTSSLSMEYDAVTSGYGNKVQQFAFTDVEELATEARKVGIQLFSNSHSGLSEDEGMNDMFADPTFSDSYQGLGRLAIGKVLNLRDQLGSKQRAVFDGLKSLLPGNEIYENAEEGAISKALRKLYKPSFMTFNYAASIGSIRRELNEDVVNGIMKEIAKANLQENEKVERVATYLASMAKVEGKSVDAKGLQEAIRTLPMSKITVTSRSIETGTAAGKKVRSKPILDFLASDVMDGVYGEAVKEVFEEKFEDFIKIQNATNDAFQTTFAVFDQLFNDRVAKHWSEGNKVLTKADIDGFLDELRPAFPVIAGPLSSSIKEGVHIYDTDLLSPDSIVGTAPSPQTLIVAKNSNDPRTKKTNTILKSLVSSSNAGAVSPFLALDGAQLATAINLFSEVVLGNGGKSSEIVPIQDAFIAPLHLMDEFGYQYNKGTVGIHENYSIVDNVLTMLENTRRIVDGEHETIALGRRTPQFLEGLKVNNEKSIKETISKAKEVTASLTTRIKIAKSEGEPTDILEASLAEAKAGITLSGQLTEIQNQLTIIKKNVDTAREGFYSSGVLVSPMVGVGRDSIYEVGTGKERADTGFADRFNDSYAKLNESASTTEIKAEDVSTTVITSKTQATETFSEGDVVKVNLRTKNHTDKVFRIAKKALEDGAVLLFGNRTPTERAGRGDGTVYNGLLEQGLATVSVVRVDGKDMLRLEHRVVEEVVEEVTAVTETKPTEATSKNETGTTVQDTSSTTKATKAASKSAGDGSKASTVSSSDQASENLLKMLDGCVNK